MDGPFRILIIDDSPDILDMLGALLDYEGFEVVSAQDPLSGLRAAYQAQPDAILLDVVMPRLSGQEVMDGIRETRPDIRFLFISGYSEDTIGSTFLDDEGFNMIQKPFKPNDLLRKIREMLDR